MGTDRTFVVNLPKGETGHRLRSALGKLTGEHAISVTMKDDGAIEFRGDSPGYALLEIRLLSPNCPIFERREDGSEDAVTAGSPDWIEGIVSCPNKNCITVQPKEPTRPRLRVLGFSPPKVQCYYCGRYVPEDSLIVQLSG